MCRLVISQDIDDSLFPITDGIPERIFRGVEKIRKTGIVGSTDILIERQFEDIVPTFRDERGKGVIHVFELVDGIFGDCVEVLFVQRDREDSADENHYQCGNTQVQDEDFRLEVHG